MSYKNLPAQLRGERWMDQREVQNLMGRYVYHTLLKRETEIYDAFWCRETPEPTLGVNGGYYRGEAAIRGLYEAKFRNTETVSKHMQKLFPDFLEKYSDIELHGVGSLDIDALCSPVVFVAEDGRTAKGVWCVMGLENNIFPNGPYSMLGYGYILADFVKEGCDWKLWHMLQLDELTSPVAKDWSLDWEMPPADARFEALEGLSLPEPTLPCAVYEKYSAGRAPKTQLRIPVPYRTFAETFSYGI